MQQEPTCLIVDSSGLQVCGQGEWHTQKHGEKQHKRWKKLHIGVDAQGHIVAATVTESHEQDPSHVPELLSQSEREIARFIGDGMYDKEPVYAAAEQHSPGAQVIIPPRKDAVLSHTGTPPDATRPAPVGAREGRAIAVETDVGVLRTALRRACLFQMQTDVRRRLTGEAGGVPGAGSLARWRVAQSDAGVGSSAVLSGQLKAAIKGPSLLPVDLCTKALVRHPV